MLATLACVFGGFVFLVVRAYRGERTGEPFRPEGKRRWTATPESGAASAE